MDVIAYMQASLSYSSDMSRHVVAGACCFDILIHPVVCWHILVDKDGHPEDEVVI